MHRAVLSVMSLIIAAVAPTAGEAQGANDFIGTWTYVSNVGTRNGNKFYPYSADTIGMLVFAPNGRYTVTYIGSGFPRVTNPTTADASRFRFESRSGLSNEQFLQRDAQLRAAGFALINKQAFEDEDGVSIQAVWTINDPIGSQPQSQQSCNFSPWLPSNEHQALFDKSVANHLYAQVAEGRSGPDHQRQYRGCYRPFPTNKSGSDGTASRQPQTGVFAHFGTYIVNEAEKTFTFKVEAATYPPYVNTEQKRLFVISDDNLSYSDVDANGTITYRRDK